MERIDVLMQVRVRSPDAYVMARLLQPEMVGYNYMTASAQYAHECMDGRTGEPFEPILQISQRLRLMSIRCKEP
jgi:hypothetical protein